MKNVAEVSSERWGSPLCTAFSFPPPVQLLYKDSSCQVFSLACIFSFVSLPSLLFIFRRDHYCNAFIWEIHLNFSGVLLLKMMQSFHPILVWKNWFKLGWNYFSAWTSVEYKGMSDTHDFSFGEQGNNIW